MAHWSHSAWRRRLPLLALALLVATLVLAATAVPGGADTPGNDSGPDPDPLPADLGAIAATQDRLLPVADAATATGGGDPAYASTTIDPVTGTVTVYRVGGDDADAKAYHDQAGVRVAPALLSKTQADDLDRRVGADDATLLAAGIRVGWFEPDAYGGAYRVGVEGADKHRATLQARYGQYGTGTVQVEEAGDGEPGAGRLDDSPPYYGGARIQRTGGNTCTSGWGAYGNVNGADYVVTAYHCVNPNDKRMWDGGGINAANYMGQVTAWSPDLDAAFIKVSATNRIWDGTIGHDFTKGVVGYRVPAAGMGVCVSGSYSGVRCNGFVTGSTSWYYNSATGQRHLAHGYNAKHRVTGNALAGKGDSGAPVFLLSGSTNVSALGIFSYGWDEEPCPGIQASWRKCWRNIKFPAAWEIASRHNLSYSHP